MEAKLDEVYKQLASTEGDKQCLEQQVTELTARVDYLEVENKVLKENVKEIRNRLKMKQPIVVSRSHLGLPLRVHSCLYMTDTYKPKLVMADFKEYKEDNEICYTHTHTDYRNPRACAEG